MENSYDLIISIVNRGHSDPVVEASREAGARGGTIIYGRGTGNDEVETFMGVSIQPEKEIIMTLAKAEKKNTIMEAICEKASMNSAGKGICFSLPVTDVRGLAPVPLSQSKARQEESTKAENIEIKSDDNATK